MDQFLKELNRIKNQWKSGLLVALLLRSVGFVALALAVLCWLDLLLAFSPVARSILVSVSLCGVLVWLAIRVVLVLSMRLTSVAHYADNLLQNRRREILSALELSRDKHTGKSPLLDYLTTSTVTDAGEKLAGISSGRSREAHRAAMRQMIFCLIIALAPALFNGRAASILLGRMLVPHSDIPPYSKYIFEINPEESRVIYGSDHVVNVTIKGGKLRHPVKFVTRQNDQRIESPCFQAGPTNYMQRLERIMQPVEFCFVTGKARSKWHTINVLYQPKFESASISITPPKYTGWEEKSFALGSEELVALKGSEIKMSVRSNRPLKRGVLTVRAADGLSLDQSFEGDVSAENEVSFVWSIKRGATLFVSVWDIQGTPSQTALEVRQQLLPDSPPTVELDEPGQFVLATPQTTVPVFGRVEDDIGIKRADINRAVIGYRSRSLSVDLDWGSTTCEATGRVELASLGVLPGEVIEVFIEAVDTNPELTGIGASSISRIQVIAESEYAEMIRAQTTIAAFEERFLEVARQYEKMNELLDELKEAVERGELDSAELQKKMAVAQKAMQEAAGKINQIAEDFAAFDMEEALAQTAKELSEGITSALNHPGWKSGDREEMKKAIEAAQQQTTPMQGQVDQLRMSAEEVAAVSRLMECSAQYKALVERQSLVVRRLEKYLAGDRNTMSQQVMAKTEDQIREGLEALLSVLEERADNLTPGYEELHDSAKEFASIVRELDISTPMKACSQACLDEESRKAWNQASLALEKMESVIKKCGGCFGGLCENKITFKVSDQLSSTLSQMLQSLSMRYAQSVGQGQGIGAAGMGVAGASQGSYMNGFSPLNVPVYGPSRYNPYASSKLTKSGKGQGGGSGKGAMRKVQYSEVMHAEEKSSNKGTGFALDSVPSRYQEAVKEFYSGEE